MRHLLKTVAAVYDRRFLGLFSGFTVLALYLMPWSGYANSTNTPPKFDEVYHLLQTNLAGVSETDLDHAAVKGLLNQLQTRAMLVGDPSNSPPANASCLGRALVYDGSCAYLRVDKVQGDLGEKFTAAWRLLNETNKGTIKGLVLDLRFADGNDFAAAGAVADLFLNSDQPLLDWGTGSARATQKTSAISVPVAILINARTSGAAEALAAVMRKTRAGLLLGSATAGQAGVFKEFPLDNGDKLRVATAQVKLGDGAPLTQPVNPDIAVATTLADEKTYWDDPYKNPANQDTTTNAAVGATNTPSTNTVARRHFNEVELQRETRDGADLEAAFGGGHPIKYEPDKPTLSDPTLARALDLLKGLAVVQQPHPG